MWIAHLSEPHLKPTGVLYQGVADPNAALLAAVGKVNALWPQPDLVLLTGDVVEGGTTAEYNVAWQILRQLRPRLLVIPGNHDNRETFRATLQAYAPLPSEGPLSYAVDDAGPLRIIALDVTVPGFHHGEAGTDTLVWLDTTLAAAPDRPTIVTMHQPPIVCGVPYLDTYACRGREALAGVVSRYPAVEAILCGHLHRHMQAGFGGTMLGTAPAISTTIALRPYPEAIPASFMEPPASCCTTGSRAER